MFRTLRRIDHKSAVSVVFYIGKKNKIILKDMTKQTEIYIQ